MTHRLLTLAVCLSAAACASSSSTSGSGINANTSTATGGGGGAVNNVKKTDDDCKLDADCGGNGAVCNKAGYCSKPCTVSADCTGGSVALQCGSDDGKRAVCVRTVDPIIGKACAPDPDGVICVSNDPKVAGNLSCYRDALNSGRSICTTTCSSDLECPSHMGCRLTADLESPGNQVSRCMPRDFCAPCVTDEQCGAGNICIDHGSGVKFCSKTCRKSGAECPGYATCADQGDGSYACVHSSGTCQGDGALCSACSQFAASPCGDNPDNQCLTISGTGESFCSQPCSKTEPCPAGYGCTPDGNCMPAKFDASKQLIPNSLKCVKKIVTQYSKIGDTMDDFAMVGVYDTDQNLDLTTETPELLHLSDFSEGGKYWDNREFILVTVSAIWCGYCQQETAQFKAMMQSGKFNNLHIFQIINDGASPGTPITMKNAMKQWIKPLKAQGAVGVDPDGISDTWIGLGSGPPLNILIDAQTRKVKAIAKGSPQEGMAAWLNNAMK
jgi:thiol-disulfide isomerase/thioredoxin